MVLTELYGPLKRMSVTTTARDLKLPFDYQYDNAKPLDVVKPLTMFGDRVGSVSPKSSLQDYAQWLTAPSNPQFTKVIVNRLWKEVFGIGIIEPVDDITDYTKPSNPELLAYLEDLFRELDFDIKAFLRILHNTQASQRVASQRDLKPGEPYHFEGPLLRRMTAEQVWDSIVSLSVPHADGFKPRLKSQLSDIERLRLISKSLEGRTLEEFQATLNVLAPLMLELQGKETQFRRQLQSASKKRDRARIGSLRSEMKEYRVQVIRKIRNIGYVHLRGEIEISHLLKPFGLKESDFADSETNPSAGAFYTRRATKLAAVALGKAPANLDPQAARAWYATQKAEFKEYDQLIRGMARASELTSPAPRGHFLRDFGQSDREVIENANDNASIPQALNLLNGSAATVIANRYSPTGHRIHAERDVSAKIRTIFRAVLTRDPTDAELRLLQTKMTSLNNRNREEQIVWTLLNTQQFLFIQ